MSKPLTDEEVDALSAPAPQAMQTPQGVPTGPLTDAQVDALSAPAAPQVGLLQSFGRGALEGATFGFDDELGLQDRAAREASKKANPWTHFMGEMAGTVVPMVGAAPLAAVKGVGLLARGARALGRPLALGRTDTLAQSVGQGAKLGAVYGGLSGAGHTDTTDNRPDQSGLLERAGSAAIGSLVGGALGVPLGAAGHGVSRLAQSIGGAREAARAETQDAGAGALVALSRGFERDRITPDDLITAIRSEFPDDTAAAGIARRFWGPLNNKQPITADQVEETVRRAMAGESAADISTALSASGTGPGPRAVQSLLDELAERHLGPVNLVDRTALARTGSGQNTQMQMRAAAATPGEATSIARENLLERQVGAPGRMQDLFNRMLGSTDFDGVAARHADDLDTAANRAYTAAFTNETPFNLAPIFSRWEGQFDKMRGVIPDTIRQRINAMMWTGTDAAGNTVKIPPQNLQGFMYAREGLRDIIGELPQGNNLKRHLTKFYTEMTDEVARTNPRWAEANQIYRDGMAATDALEAGARMSGRLNARSREGMAEFNSARDAAAKATKALRVANQPLNAAKKTGAQLSDTQQAAIDTAQARLEAANARLELFKVGLVRALNDALMNKSETANLTRELMLPGAKQMLRQILGPKDADQFFRALQAEATMQRTYQSQFGSQTTPLREAVDDLNWAPRFEAAWSNLGLGKVLQLASEYAARNINNARNQQLMKLYTETDPLRQLEILKAAKGVHAARSNAKQIFGTPALASPAPVADALMSLREPSMNERPRVMTPYRP